MAKRKSKTVVSLATRCYTKTKSGRIKPKFETLKGKGSKSFLRSKLRGGKGKIYVVVKRGKRVLSAKSV